VVSHTAVHTVLKTASNQHICSSEVETYRNTTGQILVCTWHSR